MTKFKDSCTTCIYFREKIEKNIIPPPPPFDECDCFTRKNRKMFYESRF